MIKIREKPLAGNKCSLLLDIYHHGQRKRETLGLYTYKRPRTEQERQHNKEAKAQAESTRSMREQELSAAEYSITPQFKKRVDLLVYYEQYANSYNKKNARAALASFKHFKAFWGGKTLSARELTETVCIEFREYLDGQLHGETPYDYFAHFKRMLKKAVRDGLLSKNPAANVTNKKIEGIKKDVLNSKEIQKLASTPCGSAEVKRAFLFACYTGLRAADVRTLKWKHIKGEVLEVVQSKTQVPVRVPLAKTASELLGSPGAPEQFVFILPSQNGVNKTLKAWATRAKLGKHVTFHVARHSFATNLLLHGSSIVSVSSSLGHRTLTHTQKYVRAVESMKRKDIDRLPKLKLGKHE